VLSYVSMLLISISHIVEFEWTTAYIKRRGLKDLFSA
jgi:hypothetical protein